MAWRVFIVVSIAAALVGCAAPAARLDPAADADPFGPLEWMVCPTQGRPALVKVGGQFPLLFRVPEGFTGSVVAELHPADGTGQPVVLAVPRELPIAPAALPMAAPGTQPDQPERLAGGLVKTPDYAAPGLYDLAVALVEPNRQAPLRLKIVPRAVALYDQFPDRFRFVQLSNMDVGDPTAPDFSDELVEEVNRLAPAFIITTGSYLQQARAAGDADAWRKIKRYFARFEAPVFLVAGDRDHETSFTAHVAASRSGYFAFGRCRGILLHDTYANPIDADMGQIVWMDDLLAESGPGGLNFLVSPSDSLRVLDAARKLGSTPADYVRQRRVGLIFCGSHTDWDFVEQAAKLGKASVQLVRTHMSSTCIRGKASGMPHYRIVNVDLTSQTPTVRCTVPEDGPGQRAQHSVPVGMWQVRMSEPNDGSAQRQQVTVINRLTVPLPDVRLKLWLAQPPLDGRPVTAVGGRIERIVERANHREVWLRMDCPDRGTANAVVALGQAAPASQPDVRFEFLGDPVLTYRPCRAADGFGYYATGGQIQLRIVNNSAEARSVWPIVRLNGNVLVLEGRPVDQPITVNGGQEVIVTANPTLGLAAPGEHWLTVQQADDPLARLTFRPIELRVIPD